nr:structural protein [Tolivirales sp.]
MKMRMLGDAVLLKGSIPLFDVVSATSGPQTLYDSAVDPASFGGNITVVAANYQEYIVQSSSFHYVPNVGTTTSGKIWAAYFDNPEVIYRMLNNLTTDPYVLIKRASTVHCWPVWAEKTMVSPSNRRRRQFQIDKTPPYPYDAGKDYSLSLGVADIDRSVQGSWFWFVEGAPAETNCGVVNVTAEVKLIGLQDSSISGV